MIYNNEGLEIGLGFETNFLWSRACAGGLGLGLEVVAGLCLAFFFKYGLEIGQF